MRPINLLPLAVLFFSVLPLTGEESPAPEKAAFTMADAIQPRNEGAQWFYKSQLFENGGWQPAGSAQETVQTVIEIDGVTCYKIQLTMDWRTLLDRLVGEELTEHDYSYFWEYVNADGSYNYSGGECGAIDFPAPTSLDQFALTLPYPVEEGHSYVAEGMAYTVVETGAETKVPAGTFVCTVYGVDHTDDPQFITQERFYMAPGVGLVRWEESEKVGDAWQPTYKDELIRYDLNEEAAEAKPAATEATTASIQVE